MQDTVAKVCLAIIALAAITGAIVLTGGTVAASLVTLAGVCAGAIGGVAYQALRASVPVETVPEVSTIVPPVGTDSPDVV